MNSPLPDPGRALSYLDHGAGLARALRGDKAKPADAVWCLVTEAVDLVDRLPDQERRWLTSGHRSGGWSNTGLTASELQEIERIRAMSGIAPLQGEARYQPQKSDLERALDVLEWLRWLNGARHPRRLTKATVALARGGDHEAVHRLYAPNRKPNRQTIHEIKTRAAAFILRGLKNDLGIVPGPDLTFHLI